MLVMLLVMLLVLLLFRKNQFACRRRHSWLIEALLLWRRHELKGLLTDLLRVLQWRLLVALSWLVGSLGQLHRWLLLRRLGVAASARLVRDLQLGHCRIRWRCLLLRHWLRIRLLSLLLAIVMGLDLSLQPILHYH